MLDNPIVARIIGSGEPFVEVRRDDPDLAAALEAGLVETFVSKKKHHATLTPFGAFKAEVELHEHGWEETPRWVKVGTPRPQIKLPHEWGRVHLGDVAWIAIVEARDFLVDRDTAEPVVLMGVKVGLLKPKPRRGARKKAARAKTRGT
jgi:hypothetical protein